MEGTFVSTCTASAQPTPSAGCSAEISPNAPDDLPGVLRRGSVNAHFLALSAEFQPATPCEQFLVMELARHAAALATAEESETAVLRRAAIDMSHLGSFSDPTAELDTDQRLAAAFSTVGLANATRFRRQHEKGFYTALHQLRELQQARRECQARHAEELFRTEEECVEFLRARFTRGDWRCPHCGDEHGSWLAKRQRWECSQCHRQLGPAAGTIMAKTRLPLVIWFAAIREMLARPDITAAELGRAVGLNRPATARALRSRIRAAFAAPDRTTQLAGLDCVFPNVFLPEPSVRPFRKK